MGATAGSHALHCCFRHGCQYGDKDCPVIGGTVAMAYSLCKIGIEQGENCSERIIPRDLLMGNLPAKKFNIVATWAAACGNWPSPRLETAYVDANGLLMAQCGYCKDPSCRVTRHLRTVEKI